MILRTGYWLTATGQQGSHPLGINIHFPVRKSLQNP